jgi:hypothetical protein
MTQEEKNTQLHERWAADINRRKALDSDFQYKAYEPEPKQKILQEAQTILDDINSTASVKIVYYQDIAKITSDWAPKNFSIKDVIKALRAVNIAAEITKLVSRESCVNFEERIQQLEDYAGKL